MNERNRALDVLKGFAIILVVIGHICSEWSLLIKWIYSFHMPLFFAISGYIEANKYENNQEGKRTSIKEYVTHKSKNVLWVYVVWATLYTVANVIAGSKNGNWKSVQLAFFCRFLGISLAETPIGAIWFLMVLYEVEILAFVLRKSKKEWLNAIIIFIGFGIYVNGVKVTLPFLMQLLWIGLLFYQFGALLYRYHVVQDICEWTKRQLRSTIIQYGIWGMAFGMLAVIALYNESIILFSQQLGVVSITIFVACGEILICFVVATLISNEGKIGLLSILGKETLIIMTTHFYVNAIFVILFGQFTFTILLKKSLIMMLLWSVCITVICYGISLFVRKYLPFLVRYPFKTKKG